MWYLAQGGKNLPRYYCYAASDDGVVWQKPNLGLIECNGSRENNIVMRDVVETMVFLDPEAPPEARFKALAQRFWPDPKKAGFYVHPSPDGIHWRISDERVCPIGSDSANQALYDGRLKKYVAYIRAWVPRDTQSGGEGLGLRKIGRIEMDDITEPWPMKMLDRPYYIWGKGKIPVVSYEVPHVFGCDG